MAAGDWFMFEHMRANNPCGSYSAPSWCPLCNGAHYTTDYCRSRELLGVANTVTRRVMPFSIAMQKIRARHRKEASCES